MLWKRLAVVVLFASALGGCKCVTAEYVDADEETFNLLAPDYTEYVQTDAKLDADQKARRLRKLETWNIRIRKAKEALK